MRHLSLHHKHLLFLLLFALMLIATTITFDLIYSEKAQKENFTSQYELIASMLAKSFTPSILFEDKEGAQQLIDQIKSNPNIESITLYLQDAEIFATFYRKNSAPLTFKEQRKPSAYFLKHSRDPLSYGHLIITYPIFHKSLYLGALQLQVNSQSISKNLKQHLLSTLLFSLLFFIMLFFVLSKLSKQITMPIISLANFMNQIEKKHNFSNRIHAERNDEIGELYHAINHLLQSIETSIIERNDALAKLKQSNQTLKAFTMELEARVQQRTKELNDSLEQLQQTHKQLLESEKMASLGNLVSGVSHEINTPIGNAVTASSIIADHAKTVTSALNGGTLKHSELTKALQTITQSAKLLDESLAQAATLIRSFKQISTDQSSAIKRQITVKTYIDEILLTFHNALKQQHVEAINAVDPTLYIYLEAGTFAQICNNLIQNSLMHAFNSSIYLPKIKFSALSNEESVTLIYEDNGIGVDLTIASTIFEPFVTTKRNDGGTGLGLSIVYNLVVQTLNGTITWHNKSPSGVAFFITFSKEQSKQ